MSIFDNFSPDDLILAFFPCTRFQENGALMMRGELYQQKNWTDEKKLDYSMSIHKELHRNYMLISEMTVTVLRKHLRMVIENPYTQPHYLTTYWSIKPKLIDKDRSKNGDFAKKPTQYFFINCDPKQNIIFESMDYVECRNIERMKADEKSRQVKRSEIHPQYASRFIRQYLIDE